MIETINDRFEKRFNKKFGFGIWDSRAKDGHLNEGIYSSDVLEYVKSFIAEELDEIEKRIETEMERFIPAYEDLDKAYVDGAKTALAIIRERRGK